MRRIMIAMAMVFCCSSLIAQSRTEVVNAINDKIRNDLFQKVHVKLVNENSILLFLQGEKDNPEYFFRAMLLESREPVASLKLSENEFYNVFIPENQQYVVLNRADSKQTILIALYDSESKLTDLRKKLNEFNAELFYCYGISFLENAWNASKVNSAEYSDPLSILVYASDKIDAEVKESFLSGRVAAAGPVGPCHSGGGGSSACSVQQGFPTTNVCSVTCNTGYFSCCNTSTFTCKCYKNGTSVYVK